MHPLGQVGDEPVQRMPPQLGLPGPVTFVHVPTEPRALHESQAPPQAELQQTPSEQKPVVHSRQPATLQSAVRSHDPVDVFWAWHAPVALQKNPAAQSLSLPQLAGQFALDPVQTKPLPQAGEPALP